MIDETQDMARAYDAVCTPEFFGFDRPRAAYHGRLDASRRDVVPRRRELYEAMVIARAAGEGAAPSVGCTIKCAQKWAETALTREHATTGDEQPHAAQQRGKQEASSTR